MIVKLHGTSGSGKTTVARELLAAGIVEELEPLGRKPSGYATYIPSLKRPLFILGPYTNVCGGLDSISDVDDHIHLLTKYAPQGHVFYEGLLQSEYYGRIGAVTEQWGDDHVFAFLDTPADVCVSRVQARRIARGNFKPFNPENTIQRIQKIAALQRKLETALKRRVVTIPYEQAAETVLELYKRSEE